MQNALLCDAEGFLEEKHSDWCNGVGGRAVAEVGEDIQVYLYDVLCVVGHWSTVGSGCTGICAGGDHGATVGCYSKHTIYLVARKCALGIVELVEKLDER